jgi:hypothetical protein
MERPVNPVPVADFDLRPERGQRRDATQACWLPWVANAAIARELASWCWSPTVPDE